jgi:hypothetical protein
MHCCFPTYRVIRLLRKLYKAQEVFRERNGRYAVSFKELEAFGVPQHLGPDDYGMLEYYAFELCPTQNGWSCVVSSSKCGIPASYTLTHQGKVYQEIPERPHSKETVWHDFTKETGRYLRLPNHGAPPKGGASMN